MSQPDAPDVPEVPAAPCIAAWCVNCGHAHAGGPCNDNSNAETGPCGCQEFVKETPTRCAFNCECASPGCNCKEHCKRHADAILAHREDPQHDLWELAMGAHHPRD